MPGVTICKLANSALQQYYKNAPDYAVVVGNPASAIKTLDAVRFKKKQTEWFLLQIYFRYMRAM